MTARSRRSDRRTGVKRIETTIPVSSYYAGISPDDKGRCCGDTAADHLLTGGGAAGRVIRCFAQGCRCNTWEDGWTMADESVAQVSPLEMIEWESDDGA